MARSARSTPVPPTPAGNGVGTDGATPAGPDWPRQATDSIVRVVDSVRDKTTGPALKAARYVVYGVVFLVLAAPLAIWGLIGLMRLAEGGLLLLHGSRGWSWLREPMWIVYLVFGFLFWSVGVLVGRSAKRPSRP